jgi:hypothetical protein
MPLNSPPEHIPGAIGMAIARIDHTMGDDLSVVAQVRF